jgi:hypothetical protein
MKQSKTRMIKVRRREAALRYRMQKFIKRLKRGDIPKLPSLQKSDSCNHEWALDGQTMQAVRWTCLLCGKSQFG